MISVRPGRVRQESGSVLVMVAVMITALLGMAALAVDLGFSYQQQRVAQAAADAAALAGAKDLPTTTTASSVASTYATSNMPGATSSVSFPTSSQIKVTVSKSVPTFFGQIFGNGSTTVSASAVAAQTTAGSCSNPNVNCFAIFAMDSNCANSNASINFVSAFDTITGGIISNGSVIPGGGNSFGASFYGPTASGCTWPTTGGPFNIYSTNSYASGPTSMTSTISTWPIDYSKDFPACSGVACTGPGGTPSFCTQSSTKTSWSIGGTSQGATTLASTNIYCAVGTGTASTPSTWNGAISLTPPNGGASSSNPIAASYVGGSVTVNDPPNSNNNTPTDYLEACGYSASGYTSSVCKLTVPTPTTTNYPLIYVTGASSTAISATSTFTSLQGDLDAPNGGISLLGLATSITFLEAQDVRITGFGFTGDGPADTAGTTNLSGAVALTG